MKNLYKIEDELYIVSSSEKIKENTQSFKQGLNGDWFYNTIYNFIARTGDITPYDFKIILTTNKSLIKDDVQAIDDEFLEWFVKNPSCEKVEVKRNKKLSNKSIWDAVEGDLVFNNHNCGGVITQLSNDIRVHIISENGEGYMETAITSDNGLDTLVINNYKVYEYSDYKIIIPKEEPKQELELKDFDNGDILDVLNMGNVEYLGNGDIIYNPNLFFVKRGDKWFIKTEKPKQETVEEAAEIDLTRLCYYDKRNPDFQIKEEYGYDKEEVEATGNFAKKDCACDNCFYGRSKLTEQLIWQQERSYSEEDMRLAIKKARDISDGKDCFDAEDISGCTEVSTYGWKFNMSEDSIIEQFKKK